MTRLDIARLLHAAARVHLSLTAEDGSTVVDVDGHVICFDNANSELIVVTEDGAAARIPVQVHDMVVAGGAR